MRTTKCKKFVNRKEDLSERLTKNILAMVKLTWYMQRTPS